MIVASPSGVESRLAALGVAPGRGIVAGGTLYRSPTGNDLVLLGIE